jgi:type II secretory ATPase GspE/PulE/Tfp pilus assembly ATPase PilB-like protein
VNKNIGFTFADAMRSFLRADPDVIMVGEMRDVVTTRVGIEASLTGHLVLSTLHTNSAPESVVRLLDLGMDPFNFADALQAILAQRLVKSLCPKCKQAYEADDAEVDALAEEFIYDTKLSKMDILTEWQSEFAPNRKFTLYRAIGCSACNQTGYKGRIGIHELMTVSAPLKHLIQTRAAVSELLDAAFFAGMRTLKQDGIHKILQGKTDLAQIRAVSI